MMALLAQNRESRRISPGTVSLLLLATAVFVWRGPARALQGRGDFAVLYGATRAWADGANPYDPVSLTEAFVGGGGPSSYQPPPSLHPPMAFPLLFLTCLPSWRFARALWLALNLVLAVSILAALLRTAGVRAASTAGLGLLAFSLLLAPLHTGIALGQVSLAVTACLLAALHFDLRRSDIPLGIVLAVAAALKPQTGAWFALFYLCRGRWVAVISAGAAMILLGGVGLGRLWLAGTDWLPSLRDALHGFLHGGMGDPTAANPLRYQLVNLHYPLHTLIASRALVNAAALLVAGALTTVAVIRDRRSGEPKDKLGVYSLLAVASLLVTYHRSYDAVVLMLALAWIVGGTRRPGLLELGVIAVFCVPGPALLHLAADQGRLPAPLVASWWWERLILPHQAWALLLLAPCLVRRALRRP